MSTGSAVRIITAAPPHRSSSHISRRAQRLAAPTVLFLVFMGIWYAVALVVLPENQQFLLPTPHEVVQGGFLDANAFAEIVSGLWSTTRVAMTGLALATVIGIGLAIVMSQAQWAEDSLYPYAVVLQTIPVLALVPLVGLWFGFDFRSRVLISLMIALFPVITNTLFGLRSTAREHHDLFTLHDAGRLTRLVRLQLPSALPSVFTGLRIAAGGAVIGAIVGDFFFRQGDRGIGRLIDVYRSQLASDRLIAAIAMSSLLGIAAFLLIGVTASRALRSWHDSAARR